MYLFLDKEKILKWQRNLVNFVWRLTFLFCIHTNDIPSIPLSSNIDAYVDDSKLSLTFMVENMKETVVKLEKDLHNVAKWCFEHQLLINPEKTKFLLIGSRPMLQNLPMNISLKFLNYQVCKIGQRLGDNVGFKLII